MKQRANQTPEMNNILKSLYGKVDLDVFMEVIYKGFFKEVEDVISENASSSKRIVDVTAFKWINSTVPMSNLRSVLIGKEIIGEVQSSEFNNAFSGKEINKIIKIKWMPSKGENPNKVELFYLLNALVENKLIENVFPDKGEATVLYNKITKIFTDVNGRPIENCKQSYQNFTKRKKKEITIDAMQRSVRGKRSVAKAFIYKIGELMAQEGNITENKATIKKYYEKGGDKNADKYEEIVKEVIQPKN